MAALRIEQQGADVLLAVKAVPGASCDQLAGALGDRLKVRVAAPPEDGKANRAIVKLLAHALGVKTGGITIERGHATADKLIRIANADSTTVRAALA